MAERLLVRHARPMRTRCRSLQHESAPPHPPTITGPDASRQPATLPPTTPPVGCATCVQGCDGQGFKWRNVLDMGGKHAVPKSGSERV